MKVAELSLAWKRASAPAVPAPRPAMQVRLGTASLVRASWPEPCGMAGDEMQPCNPEGGTYVATRSDGRQRRLCGNHAAKFAAVNHLPFPTVTEPKP